VNLKRAAFTLIELLVAMTILSIMMIVMAVALSFVARVWTVGAGSVDNVTNARLMLSLMDRDVQMMVLRRDLGAFVDSTGNPAFAFYTKVQGSPGTDTRAISLVQYLLNPATVTTAPVLWRTNCGMNFATASGVTAAVGATTTLPTTSTTQTDSLNGVVQFKYQFIDGTGALLTPAYSLTSTPPSTSSPPSGAIPPATIPFWFDYSAPGASYNPRVVVVSMVVLNNSAYNLAVKTGTMPNLISCFSTAPPGNQTYSQVWNAFLDSPNTTFLALPEAIRQGVEVFEHHIPLPITPVAL
jgi:prepilin-type N-terminal cleavage/methylation domain-containing protein